MKVTPILWTYDKRKDGTCPVKIRYSDSNRKKYYHSDCYVLPEQWDHRNKRVRNNPNATDINLKLIEIETTVEREYIKNKGVDIDKLINELLNPRTSTNNRDAKETHFLPYMLHYINECKQGNVLHYKTKQRLTEGYIRTLETSYKRIEWYCNKIGLNPTFDQITEEFHDRCMYELRYYYTIGDVIGMAENSIGKTTKQLKRVMEYAKIKKLHTNFEYENFISVAIDVDNIALTDAEVDRMLNLKLDKDKKYKYLVAEQERFSIAYNFLLRFNDSLKVNKKNIFMDAGRPFLRMITGKTKQEVIIPIMARNYEILKKNNFEIKQTNNQNSNERVKTLGMLAEIKDDYTMTETRQGKIIQTVVPKYKMITTHTTRRSAATNLYLSGIDLKRIQLMEGWKSIKQLENYLKIDKLMNAKLLAEHTFFNR